MEKAKEELFIEKWEKLRTKGIVKFSLLHGGLYGVLLFVVLFVVDLFKKPFADVFTMQLFIDLGMYVLAGIVLLGPFEWLMGERQYKRYKQQ